MFELKTLQQYSRLEFIARQIVEGFITGLHKSPFHGFSVEFAEHRQYNKGESIKHIDWKLYGRTERLYVKKFEEETNLRCRIILDNSSSMHFPKIKTKSDILNKSRYAIFCAAVFIEILRRQRDAAGLTVFSDHIETHTEAKSTNVHQKQLFHFLDQIYQSEGWKEKKTTSVAPILHEIADKIHKRSLIIVLSDMMETSGNDQNLFQALQHLKHNRHEVVVFNIMDAQKELDFNYDNRPYRFVDSETQQEIKLHPAEIRSKYKNAISKYYQQIRIKCNQYKIDFVNVDINQDFQQAVYPYLLKRKKLY